MRRGRSRTIATWAKLGGGLLTLTIALLAAASLAAAKGTYDLRGVWNVGGSGGSATGQLKITSMNLATGQFSGTSYGGMFKLKGTETANKVKFTQSETGYASTDIATVSAGGTRMSGTWHDTNGSGGTWTGRRVSGPKARKHHVTKKHKHRKKRRKHH